MLSLFRDRSSRFGLNTVCATAVLASGWCFPVQAAQYYWQPAAELSAQTNSNLELDPAVGTDRKEGYIAEVSSRLGVATTRSDTMIIPRLQYQKYPDVDGADRLQGDLSFSSNYNSPRSALSVLGVYQHLDELNAELANARFDRLNPNQPLSPETGQVRPGATRDVILLNPTYTYRLNERFGLGTSVLYQGINYSPDDDVSAVDFDYYRADVFLKRALSPRADIAFSPYVAKYKARDIDSKSDSVGGAIGLEMRWSKTLVGRFNTSVERAKIDQTEPQVNKDTVTAWGADFSLTRTGEISELILSLGRAVTPSGGGSLYYTDQVQVQYDRDLSARLKVLSAARYIRDRSLGNVSSTVDRDYGQADVGIQWMMSRTWYLRAGYTYISQKYDFETDTARNNRFEVSVGYRGLDRQQ